MGLATIFRVFKNSSLLTTRSEFTISRVFPDCKSAIQAQYRFFFMEKDILIYRRRSKTGRATYAYIGE
jgi:hypothetical protein